MALPIPRGLPTGTLRRQLAQGQTYDLSGTALPSGLTLSRASSATIFDASGSVSSASNNAARFAYDYRRPDKGLALLIEPASQNWAKNGAWTGAVAASSASSFNTTTGQNAGTWGTIPGNCAVVIPALSDGSTSGWQIVGTGTEAGAAYIDMRFKLTNAATPSASSTKNQRFLFTLATGSGVSASGGEAWTCAAKVKIVSGGFGDGGSVSLTLRSLNGSGALLDLMSKGLPISTPGDAAYLSRTGVLSSGAANLSAGVSVATPAGTATDITLRISLPMLERAAASTSPIITNNSTYATRSADTLTIATGLGAGTYYVRWRGIWANYDAVITSTDGNLVLTTPPGAIADGCFLFGGVSWSTQPFPPDPRRLQQAPTALGSNVFTATIPTGASYLPVSSWVSPITGLAYGVNGSFEPDLDVVLTADAVVTRPIKVVGGRCVRVIGVAFAPTDTAADWARTRSILGFYGQCVEAYAEGCLFDGGNPIQRDPYNWTGGNPVTGITYTPRVVMQNCRSINCHGQYDHARWHRGQSHGCGRSTLWRHRRSVFRPGDGRMLLSARTDAAHILSHGKPPPFALQFPLGGMGRRRGAKFDAPLCQLVRYPVR